MRLFVALDIDDNIRGRLSRFVEGVRGFSPEARWVRPESLHVTLKFIGEKPGPEVELIKQALRTIEADTFEMNFCGYGFFPGARAARVFWVGIESRDRLTALAATVDKTLAQIDIAKEEHAFSPHLTLARRGGGSGPPHKQNGDHLNRDFEKLQEKLAALPAPEFGIMTARQFFLYQSKLSPKGSTYTKLAGFSLP
ncbi:MAG: RNA 2',3'-cyclic phosphodiesterase [Candidatus Sulfotelmatobacter sp.]